METADDNSETQSQAHTDLLWDHAGDVESDPLLGGEGHEQQIQDVRPNTLQLSYEQAQELIKILDNTRIVLETFVGQAVNGSMERSRAGPRHGWWASHCFPARRRSIAKFILIITAALQAVNLMIVSIIDIWPRRDDKSVMMGTGITMFLLQIFNLFFIIMVSGRLVRQLYKHKVSMLLLAQSYLATLLLFAGIYTLTYRLDAKSWKFIQEELQTDPILVIELYSKFLYFSVSTATLCGSDNVLPKYWYNCLFTAIQMLMSFIYFASILGQTLSQDTQYWLGVGSSDTDPTPTTSARPARQPSSISSVNAARVSRISNHVWRNYGSSSRTTSVSFPQDPRAQGDGRMERDRGHSVIVDVQPDRSNSINNSSPT